VVKDAAPTYASTASRPGAHGAGRLEPLMITIPGSARAPMKIGEAAVSRHTCIPTPSSMTCSVLDGGEDDAAGLSQAERVQVRARWSHLSSLSGTIARMDLELQGRTAAVIGGSSGIGADVAGLLAEEGCDVAVTYRSSPEGAEQTAALVRSHGRAAWVAPLDLSTADQARHDALALVATLGELDVLVLCAGHNIVTPYNEISADEWAAVLNANLTGAFFALQAITPAIRPGGSVVTVASVAAHTGAPHHMHYAAAKAGLVNLTTSLARELAPHVRINCVAPGITMTPMGADTVANLPEDYAQKRLLLQRYATSRRVAQMIAIVASPVSEFMTGACIDINSGRNVR
jgi:3-oxoacyl-[acyl-carrier protein] reductase